MGDSGLLAAIAQWVSTIGVPAMVIAWFRLWQESHRLSLEIVALKGKMTENEAMRHDVNEIKATLTDVRIMVSKLSTQMDYQSRERRASDRSSD